MIDGYCYCIIDGLTTGKDISLRARISSSVVFPSVVMVLLSLSPATKLWENGKYT